MSTKEKVKRLKPIDDILFQKLAEDKMFCQELLRVIMQDTSITVIEVIPQNSIQNLHGRSVRVDLFCINGQGKYFNVEVQKANDDNHIKRVRYNASCITANITDPGTKFEKVPDICIIYITSFDIFNQGKTIYHAKQIIAETGTEIQDGFTSIYANTQINDNSVIAEYLQCFKQEEVNNSKFPEITRVMSYYKHNEEGLNMMCNIAEEIKNETIEKIGTLTVKLLEDNRIEDLKRSAKDLNFQRMLMKEYGLEE